MQNHVYADYPQLEEKHWWYAARRKFINRLIQLYPIEGQRRWLDAGCGTGGNLRSLHGPETRLGIDFSQTALRVGLEAYEEQDEQNGQLIQWICGDVGRISLKNNAVDMITCLDVLEHVPDDSQTIKEFYRTLAPNGLAIFTVPAHPFLWSSLDRTSQHYRRYTPAQFHELICTVDWEIVEWGSFNSILFPIMAGVRLFQRFAEWVFPIRLREGASQWSVGPCLGKWFHSIFLWEHKFARWLPRWFGVSLYAVCQKVVHAEVSSSTLLKQPGIAKSRTETQVPINAY